jgi:hypothetical protein
MNNYSMGLIKIRQNAIRNFVSNWTNCVRDILKADRNTNKAVANCAMRFRSESGPEN